MTHSRKARYNLNLVLQETGIKADTLRAWERRYMLPQPARTEGGHRLFSDYDIATIKWLQSRQDEGMRISQAVEIWREIEESGKDPLDSLLADQDSTLITNAAEKQTITELSKNWVEACLAYDEIIADQIFDQAFVQFPFDTVFADLIHPSLTKIGNHWYQGKVTVQQEHFASELVVRKIQALLSTAPKPIHSHRILVGCPPGEHHTISALMITLLLRYRGWDIIYLGGNVPEEKIMNTIRDTKPSIAIFTSAQLRTAASLLDIAKIINNHNVPVAFSGLIFTQIDGLSERIPGYYLGSTLNESILLIENLITNPQERQENSVIDSNFVDTIMAFTENKTNIEAQVLDKINSNYNWNIPVSNIYRANTYLFQDIIASLKLGDINLINFNLDWIKGLMTNHALSQDILQDYLKEYSKSVTEHLGDLGKPISEWLESLPSI